MTSSLSQPIIRECESSSQYKFISKLIHSFINFRRNHWNHILIMQKSVCIIGAGNSGIGAFGACIEQGFLCTCFEKSGDICGMWRYHGESEQMEGVASIYKSLTINTSKEMTAFSRFPPPEEFPNYMHNELMCRYIEMFAEELDFKKHVKLNHEVQSVKKTEDHQESGRWRVTVKDLISGQVEEHVFDGVMVCSGHNNKPKWPKIKGLHEFKGKIIHSHQYKRPEEENRRVLVIGIGNSAGDIAVEMSHANQVFLSTRTGSWVCHRVGHRGRPFDAMMLRRSWNCLFRVGHPLGLTNYLGQMYLNQRFDHKLYELEPKHKLFSQHIFICDDLPKRVISQQIKVKGDVEYVCGDGVVFRGEREVTKLDMIVLATGYELYFPFLSDSGIRVQKKDFRLYRNMFYPQNDDKWTHTLGFIGLILPIGAVLPLAELQSRYFALLLAEKKRLPPKKTMERRIKKRQQWVRDNFPNEEKHALEVYWIEWMDRYARDAGCKPALWKYFFTDIKLWSKLFFGPLVPYQYRLTGENTWSGAREAIMRCEERMEVPFRTRHH